MTKPSFNLLSYFLEYVLEHTFNSGSPSFGNTVNSFLCIGPPVFTIKPGNKTVKEGSMNVSFTCNATSYPSPTLTWFKNGNVIKRNSTNFALSEDKGTITIKKVERGDAGFYVCNATNEIKSLAVGAYLNVLCELKCPIKKYLLFSYCEFCSV